MSEVKEQTNELVDFSKALAGMKEDKAYSRKGWNGKGLFVRLAHEQESLFIKPFFVIVSLVTNTWVPSTSDLLAEDWYEVDLSQKFRP